MKLSNIITLSAIFSIATLTTGCAHEEIELYSGCPAGIYIQDAIGSDQYGNPTVFRSGNDSFTFTKSDEKTTKGYVSFDIKLMGEVADYDRPYGIEVLADSTTAIEGVDYSLEGNNFSIKAGANKDRVLVTLLRNPRLKKELVRVTFLIKPNENFDTPLKEYTNSSNWNVEGNKINACMYYVEFGEIYTQPGYWSYAGEYCGKWTVEKYLLLNHTMGWTVNDWDNVGAIGSKIGLGRLQFAASALQAYLQEQADAGTPVREEDGTFMQLGSQYLVDYSAYNK